MSAAIAGGGSVGVVVTGAGAIVLRAAQPTKSKSNARTGTPRTPYATSTLRDTMQRMRWLIAAALLAACGRVGFDPLGGGGSPTGDGGNPVGSDGSATGSDGLPPPPPPADALAAACQEAIPASVNVPIFKNTCDTGKDRIDGCAGAALNELVFVFTAPAAGSYTVETFDDGATTNVITTGEVDDACATNAGCFGIRQTTWSAGETHYYVVESPSGQCQNIQFSVSM